MQGFCTFFKSLLKATNLTLPQELTLQQTRYIISKINEYFYTNYDGIGTVQALQGEFEYFSEFHKFWEKNHRQILNPQIDIQKCKEVAEVLHTLYLKYGKELFYELYNTGNLSKEAICKIRYFSANQDFRGSVDFDKLKKVYEEDPSTFDKEAISNEPEDFIKKISAVKLSQNDKRVKYARESALLLKKLNIEPIKLIDVCKGDLLKVKELLMSNRGAGFGNKKADMFLRDMVVLGVWDKVLNFDRIDVASDVNTIKVALRTGILKTDIVLLSSFLDIFCYQYTLMDEMNAKAWRKVWEIWHDHDSKACVESPCLIDYLVYKVIGKEVCKEILYIYKCDTEGHTFKWHSGKNKTCQICYQKHQIKNNATVIKKILPCTDAEGYIAISKLDIVACKDALLHDMKACPFKKVCKPDTDTFKKLNPPKSISILGQTGWLSAMTDKDCGGGGLMS